jgi:uncharacterized membrane protein YdcZ (DUF606 family)
MKTFYYFDMKSKILVNTVIVTAIFMTMIGIIPYVTGQELSAQLGNFGNKTSGQQEKMINGTINLQQTIFEAVGSKVNTTLTQAITTAEQTIGNNSFALAAFGGPHGGYLVYTIILGTPSMEFHKVIVDPGTGQILASQAISHEEWMRMQQMQQMMHSGGGPGGGGMMMSEGGPMMKSDHGWK